MAKHAQWAWWLTLVVGAAAALANCSKDDDAPPPGSTGKKPTKAACKSPKTMTISELSATTQPGVIQGKAKGADGKEWTLQIELSDREDFKNKPGSYDLSEQTSYDGCRQCVLGFQGADTLLDSTKQLFQTNGTIKLDTVSSPPSAISKGTLEKVELREVTLDKETGEVVEVSGGTCYQISSFDWDTTPEPGKKCQTPEDCGDPETVTCDPKTGTCVAFQCEIETNKGCSEKELCLAQQIGASYGACYPTCTPFFAEEACPSGAECVALDADQISGKCLPSGGASEGASCKPSLLGTGCAPGLRCKGPEGAEVCQRECDYFDGTVACPSGQQCAYGGFCTTEGGDSAAFGLPCSGGASEGTPCGSDGSAWRGVCSFGANGLYCQQTCRPGSVYLDCGETQVCAIGEGEAALPTCQPKVEEAL